MRKADIENDNYLIIHPDGDFTSSLNITEEELAKKEVLCLIPEFSYLDDKYALRTINEINAFTRNNPAVSNILMIYTNSTKDDFDFNEELNMEEFFCKYYKEVEHPEKIQLRVPSVFAANPDNTLLVVYENFPLSHCKSVDDKISLFIRDIKNSDLSPFEKIMATHILCSRFIDSNTDYEENGNIIPVNTDENVFSSSMHIFSDGEDGYKVKCAGYTDMFARMLKKMNIDVTPMNIFNVENGFIHTVAMVGVHDEKYGIDGRYICDIRIDSDIRQMREERELQNSVNDNTPSSYFGRDSLLYFCLGVDDYETLMGINKFSTATKYSTMPGEKQARDKISTDRLDVSDISKALSAVTCFRFGLQSNLDYYLHNDNAIESMLHENKDTISCIINSREFIDNSRKKSFSTNHNSEVELKEMLDSSKTNAIKATDKIEK